MPIAEGRTIPFVGPEHIDAAVLETFGYDGPEQEIVTETSEFSAVCPYSGLPDYARLTITYRPGGTIIDFQDGGWYDIPASEDYLIKVDPEEGKTKYKNVNSAQVIPDKQG